MSRRLLGIWRNEGKVCGFPDRKKRRRLRAVLDVEKNRGKVFSAMVENTGHRNGRAGIEMFQDTDGMFVLAK